MAGKAGSAVVVGFATVVLALPPAPIAASPAAAPAAAAQWLRGGAVDGDTVWVSGRSATVRVIGIDTPERGQCGYDRAKGATARFVSQGFRLRTSATTDNTDRYSRKLRYVQNRRGRDLGVYLIRRGLAVARYDSRDGYSWHRKERHYHRLDAQQRNVCGFNPGSSRATTGNRDSGRAFANCTEARAAGAAPVRRGDPGYGPHLDGDGDGIGCE